MEFRLLGPVEVAVEDRIVPLGSPRQRAVLAMLALAAPEVVSTDRFVDGLWGEDPPGNPLAALQVFVHGLRKVLRDASPEDLIVRDAPGYRLRIDPAQTDIGRVQVLQKQARTAREAGDLAAAGRALTEARGRWRGPALADVRSTPFAEPEAVRLDELRLLLEEDAFDVGLALGEHALLIDPLTSAVNEHPMRERFWGQLMTALYRSDRQADALATYARARERLADELGIDPGQALQQLELAILRQDPSIAAPAPAASAAVPTRRPTRVPQPTTPTFGRDTLVEEVLALLLQDGVRAVTLTGPGGSGKSRVAALAALAAADDFSEVVHLAITERTPIDQVLREVALALTGGDDPSGLDGLDSHVLVVLDNLESVDGAAGLVNDLVERTAGPTVLVTSRLPLRIRAEHDVPVPPLEVVALGTSRDEVLAAPAVAMFLDRARAVAPETDHESKLDDIAELCRFLDGFPLAIELAAAQVRVLTPGRIRASLDKDLSLLRARGVDVPERQQTLAATIEWSYERLGPGARLVADRLALFERSFTLEAVEAICDDVDDVLDALAQVVEARLVRPAESRVEVRFVALGTVRAFARARLAEQPDIDERWAVLSAHLRDRAAAWGRDLDGPEGTTIVGRYDDTAADLDAALDRAVADGNLDLAVTLVDALTDLWITTGRMTGSLGRVTTLLAAGGLTGPRRAVAHLAAGKLAYHLTDWDRTVTECRAALAVEGADERVLASARCHLGAALTVTGSAGEGAALANDALTAAEKLGDYRTTAVALSILAIGCAVTGDFEGERDYYQRRLALVSERGDVARLADTLNTLAEIALDEADAVTARTYAAESITIAGAALPLERRDATITLARASAVEADRDATAAHLLEALVLADRTGQSLALAQCLRVGGCLAVLAGEHGLAVQAFAAAQTVSPSPSGTDDPIEADLARRLTEAKDALGEEQARRDWMLGSTLPPGSTRARIETLAARSPALSRR